jgi:hypothetical protein
VAGSFLRSRARTRFCFPPLRLFPLKTFLFLSSLFKSLLSLSLK